MKSAKEFLRGVIETREEHETEYYKVISEAVENSIDTGIVEFLQTGQIHLNEKDEKTVNEEDQRLSKRLGKELFEIIATNAMNKLVQDMAEEEWNLSSDSKDKNRWVITPKIREIDVKKELDAEKKAKMEAENEANIEANCEDVQPAEEGCEPEELPEEEVHMITAVEHPVSVAEETVAEETVEVETEEVAGTEAEEEPAGDLTVTDSDEELAEDEKSEETPEISEPVSFSEDVEKNLEASEDTLVENEEVQTSKEEVDF